MNTFGDTLSGYVTFLTGFGWALYFVAGAVVTSATVAVERVRTRGKKHG